MVHQNLEKKSHRHTHLYNPISEMIEVGGKRMRLRGEERKLIRVDMSLVLKWPWTWRCWILKLLRSSPEAKHDYWDHKEFWQKQAANDYEWIWSLTFWLQGITLGIITWLRKSREIRIKRIKYLHILQSQQTFIELLPIYKALTI